MRRREFLARRSTYITQKAPKYTVKALGLAIPSPAPTR